MERFIGTKLIEAEKMTYYDFCIKKYGIYQENNQFKIDNKDKEGYLVEYENNYISWSPKDVFEKAYKKINGCLNDLQNDLVSTNNTKIEYDEITFNSPHNYIIKNSHNDNVLTGIHFQEGPTKESDINGVFIEDLIAICINRLENFQRSDFRGRENACAITKLEESLMWLRKRTINRVQRGVLGTYKI